MSRAGYDAEPQGVGDLVRDLVGNVLSSCYRTDLSRKEHVLSLVICLSRNH